MVRFKFDSSKPTLDNSFSILHLSIRHRFRSRTKWKKKRAYLSRVRNFNRIRPSRGSTSIVFTTSRQKTIFPSTRESPGASIDSRTRGKRTYDRVRGCASGSSKKRQAGIAYEQVKTNDLDERGETVVAFGGGGGEAVFADEESFHGRRGTMGNLKTRVEHKSSFPFPLLSELCPPDFLPVARFQEYSQGNNDRGGFGLRA